MIAAELVDVSFRYPQSTALTLESVSLPIFSGELLCILGPNGCGKTTLLKLLLGELSPRSGRVELGGVGLETVSPSERALKIAYVPQQPVANLHRSVFDVVLAGRLPHTGAMGLASPGDVSMAAQALAQVGLADFSSRDFATLSGGESQRVMVARALAQQPTVLLLDERTASLDIQHQYQLFDFLRTMSKAADVATVVVAHDLNLTARFAHQVCLLAERKLYAHGPAAEVITPESLAAVFGITASRVQADPPMFCVDSF